MAGKPARALAIVLACMALAGCVSSEVDPRCRIAAEGPHETQIAKSVNGSKLWQKYFDEVQPSGSDPLVEFRLTMERSRMRSHGGDYDPGKIKVEFRATSLGRGRTLFEKEADVDLEPFMVGIFKKEATRDEMQEIAFKATEEKVYPYLDRWINLAAIRAMGEARSSAFEPVLDGLIEDRWTSSDMRNAAKEALRTIRGRA